MRVFVTGGSGYVGGRLIGVLRERGYEVVASARSAEAATKVSAAGAEPCRADLNDADALALGMQGCDWVIHAAAMVGMWGPRKEFERVNVQGTQNVIDSAHRAGVRCLIYVSTEAVLLDGQPVRNADESRPLPRKPLPRYPASKGRGEQLVLGANGPELRTSVVRLPFVWGPNDTSFSSQLVDSVNSGWFAWIGGGTHLSSTCHVDNACEGIVLAALRGRGGEVYFLTDGAPRVFREFCTTLLAARGMTPPGYTVPLWLAKVLGSAMEWLWPEHAASPPPIALAAACFVGHEVTVDDSKARRELGYRGDLSGARSQGLS